MDSGDRSFSVVSFFIATTIVLAILLLGNCSTREKALYRPIEVARITSEHNLKMACIKRNGSWQPRDENGNVLEMCRFNK